MHLPALLSENPKGKELATHFCDLYPTLGNPNTKCLIKSEELEALRTFQDTDYTVAIQKNDKNWALFALDEKDVSEKGFMLAYFIQEDNETWELKLLQILDRQKEIEATKLKLLSTINSFTFAEKEEETKSTQKNEQSKFVYVP